MGPHVVGQGTCSSKVRIGSQLHPLIARRRRRRPEVLLAVLLMMHVVAVPAGSGRNAQVLAAIILRVWTAVGLEIRVEEIVTRILRGEGRETGGRVGEEID